MTNIALPRELVEQTIDDLMFAYNASVDGTHLGGGALTLLRTADALQSALKGQS